MKTPVIAIALCFSAGCTAETTMVRKVVSPRETLQSAAYIVAIEHADGTRSKPSRHVAEGDRFVVDVPGTSADASKGEELVRYRASMPMVIAGASTLATGAGVAALALACKASSSIGGATFCIVDVLAGGASLVITGIVLMVTGSSPHVYIEHPAQKRVRVAPVFDAHGGGGVLQLSF